MSLIPDSVKAEIRQAVYLPEVIVNEGVKIRRQGREWRGICPFEPGSTNASKFRVRNDHYHCFACGKKGDVFSWLQERGQVSFREAAKIAAQLAGVDIESYLRPERSAPRDPRREAAEGLLAMLAAFSAEQALALPAEERVVEGIALDALVESGEVGYLPEIERLRRRLSTLGTSAQALRDTGVEGALEALAGRWVLWARKRGRVFAARPLGEEGPTIGGAGGQSSGWIHAPRAPMAGKIEGGVRIAWDDATYLALRSAGLVPVFRAIGPQAYERLWSYIPNIHSLAEPPMLVLPPEREAQRAAYETVVHLLSETPRLRVAEFAALPPHLSDADLWRERLNRAFERAGTAFDWQASLAALHGLLETEAGRLQAARRLARLVEGVRAPVEQASFAAEMQSLTGWSPDSLAEAAQANRSGSSPRVSRSMRGAGRVS